MNYNKNIGNWAENQAARHIQNHQWHIIKRNYFCTGGEIDIIATKGKYLVFLEVKYRRSMAMGGTVNELTVNKQKRLLITAKHFLKRYPSYSKYQCRFDFIGVSGRTQQAIELQWLKNILIPLD